VSNVIEDVMVEIQDRAHRRSHIVILRETENSRPPCRPRLGLHLCVKRAAARVGSLAHWILLAVVCGIIDAYSCKPIESPSIVNTTHQGCQIRADKFCVKHLKGREGLDTAWKDVRCSISRERCALGRVQMKGFVLGRKQRSACAMLLEESYLLHAANVLWRYRQ